VFSAGRLGGPWQLFRKGRSMVGNERLRALLDSKVAGRRFDQLEVPLHVVATSLRTARERWFHEGDVTEAVLAEGEKLFATERKMQEAMRGGLTIKEAYAKYGTF
jgi:hypothetical protein